MVSRETARPWASRSNWSPEPFCEYAELLGIDLSLQGAAFLELNL
jgi:hypothetical protein